MNTAEFYKFPKDLARAIGYVCQSTGEMVKFTPSTKIVYAYMISRNEFFTGRMKGRHFESHKVIADSCGMEEKACGKIIRKMMEHGLVEAEKKQPEKGGHPRYYYKMVKTDIHLWVGSIDNPVKIPDTQHKHKKEEKQGSVDEVIDDAPPWYDEDEPF